MRTRCERRRCTAVATAAIAVDPPNQTVWIGDLEGSAPHVTVFCTACADALLVPSGWQRRDVREAPRLFGDRVMPWEKAAAELAAKGRDDTDASPPKRRPSTAKSRAAAEASAPKEPSKRTPKAPRGTPARTGGARRAPTNDPAQRRLGEVEVESEAEVEIAVEAETEPAIVPVEETPPPARLLAVMPAEAQETDEPLLNPTEATPLLARAFNQHRRSR